MARRKAPSIPDSVLDQLLQGQEAKDAFGRDEDRKDPRKKDGNDQRVPLLSATGYDAYPSARRRFRRRPASA